jgi:hypothetical protein
MVAESGSNCERSRGRQRASEINPAVEKMEIGGYSATTTMRTVRRRYAGKPKS